MNVLYLTYDGLTDQLGQSQIIPYLKGLSENGYRIFIVSCEKPGAYARLSATVKKELGSISWHPLPFTAKPPILSTLQNLRRMRQTALQLCKSTPFRIVHCRSTLAALTGLKIKKHCGARLIFDMRGFWADERVEGNLWPQSNPLYRFIYKYIKAKEHLLLTKSDHIISLTKEGKNVISNYKIPELCSVSVIPCCTDENLFNPSRYNPEDISMLKRQLEVNKDSFLVSYTGSIGTWYMLKKMLDFFFVLSASKPDAKFLFVTRENPEVIYKEALIAGIDRSKIVVKSALRSEMPLYIAASDVSLFFIRKGFSKKASSPVKMGESLMMGIPVVCNEGIGDNDHLINTYHFGWIVNNFNAEGYKEVISALLSSKNDPEIIRKKALQVFSLQRGIESYIKVYESLA